MKTKLDELKNRLAEVHDLGAAGSVLGWDQLTCMPAGGTPARARQIATLARLQQEKFTDPALGKLLDELQPYADSLPYDSFDAALVRVTRRDYDRMVKIPAPFIAELSSHQVEAFQVWAKARPENDFGVVEPYLEKTLEFSRKMAEFFPGYEHIADPLIDFADYGMKAVTLGALFAELRSQLTPIVQTISAQPIVDDSCLRLHYPEAQQLAFSEKVAKKIGYDLQRGRQDKTHHPFTISFSIGDVRITTRVHEHFLGETLFSTIHEAGHAMYEQGVSMELEGTPLAAGVSAGLHESQSRLWENVVGRSRGFWEYFYPQLQQVFPEQLGDVDLDTFYRAVNKVQPSLIRTDADEVTYNLHVMIRFDLELALLEGKLSVHDLPDAWQSRYRADLGICAPDNRDGVLQDVHWYGGLIGGVFQGYTLGNILNAQFYETALQQHPGIPDQIRQGEFGTLLGWMQENIYKHGRIFTAPELIERASGKPITIDPYIRYLRSKYGELYSF